jgi:hypothetical protein
MQASSWERNTEWRQGSVIPTALASKLGFILPEQTDSNIAIIISHDCDIVEDNLENEPRIEIIIGQIIQEADPNRTYAKSPNKLHLEIQIDGELQFVELKAANKYQVDKTAIASERPNKRFTLRTVSREILQSWLALRYRRATFPDALNKHLSLLRKTLQDIGKKNPMAVIGFYISYDPDQEIVEPRNPYEVWIVVVYDHTVPEALSYADSAAQKIVDKAEAKFKSPEGWQNIELKQCTAASDEEFTLSDAMSFKNYSLDYISLKEGDDLE